MFAVIKTGGKQHRVAQDDIIVVEKLKAEAGETFVFDQVLMLGDSDKVELGAPLVAGAQVVGEVVEQRRGAKIMIFKKKQRNTYRRKRGHRQSETVVRITDILAAGAKPAARKAAKPAAKVEAEAPVAAAAAAAPSAPVATDSRGRLSAPVGQADDLKKISGVGKVLEKKLNDAGIFHFWQVAALEAAQIEELEAEMSFPGRITRDDWVGQAAAFAKGE